MVSAEEHGEAIRIGIRCRAAGALCPGCGAWSSRGHGSYLRFPADLPSAGRRVVLCLHVRRFACADPSCERRTFAEQVPRLTRRYSRWTERLALGEVGLALAGWAGARITDVFGISVSGSTVLRLVDALPEPRPRTSRVVGVDEYAMRKAGSTAPCWSTSRPAGQWTCYLTANRRRSQPGSANVRGSG
ncbi:transposase family protein [Streptomyces inhibens]|uniref:transposase family protein n=1 Tax=Streptomyces inhibens TaxID=2293571 RepID=UPI00402AF99E